MNRAKLDEESILLELSALPIGWIRDGDKLKKEFQFTDFVKAFSFLTEVAIHSQTLDHHPRIVNVYNRVELELWTHDVGGLSVLDFELAKKLG